MCTEKTSHQIGLKSEAVYRQLAKRQQQLAEILFKQYANSPNLRGASAEFKTQTLKELARIIGGVPALPGEYNECCLIGVKNLSGTYRWFCTGVLVSPRVVITAAHCIQGGGAYVVSLNTNEQTQIREVIPTRKVIVHPQYSIFNDLAVLVLQHDSVTQPVPLATTADINAADEVELVGFGNDDPFGSTGFGLKRKVSVDMVSIRRSPDEDLNQAEATFGYESDLEFVAGGKGFDTCTGDSGGPVYILGNGHRSVAGLTSRATDNAHYPCGDGGIYTRVDVHRQFIESFF